MKNIIPFKKDVIFKTKINEVTSISLENTLNIKEDKITGEFIISGEYKINENSTSVDPFQISLPFEIAIDERYDTDKATVDIDDFYYEIVNDNVLAISIDVLLDKLQEKPIVDIDDLTDLVPVRDIIEIEEENMNNNVKKINEIRNDDDIEIKDSAINNYDEKETIDEKINSLFIDNLSKNEFYVEYNVCIIREGDTLDSIIEKYSTTLDELKKYNNLDNIEIGTKIIIPNNYERN